MAKPDGFNSYAAGNKRYGGGRDAPNIGPSDPTGYAERDRAVIAKRNAVLRKLKASQQGHYMSSAWLHPTPPANPAEGI